MAEGPVGPSLPHPATHAIDKATVNILRIVECIVAERGNFQAVGRSLERPLVCVEFSEERSRMFLVVPEFVLAIAGARRRRPPRGLSADLESWPLDATVWAEPGQGLRGTYRVLIGSVSNFNGGPLEGVLMQVIEGPNTGQSTTTFSNGGFRMENLKDGPLVIRFSKTGYVTGIAHWYIPGSKEHYFYLHPVQ